MDALLQVPNYCGDHHLSRSEGTFVMRLRGLRPSEPLTLAPLSRAFSPTTLNPIFLGRWRYSGVAVPMASVERLLGLRSVISSLWQISWAFVSGVHVRSICIEEGILRGPTPAPSQPRLKAVHQGLKARTIVTKPAHPMGHRRSGSPEVSSGEIYPALKPPEYRQPPGETPGLPGKRNAQGPTKVAIQTTPINTPNVIPDASSPAPLRPGASGVRLARSAPPFSPPGSALPLADLPRDESRSRRACRPGRPRPGRPTGSSGHCSSRNRRAARAPPVHRWVPRDRLELQR